MNRIFNSTGAPKYHDGMLVVETRPSLSPHIAVAGIAAAAAGPGMSALSFYERAGMIKRVVPITKPDAAVPRRGSLGIATYLAQPSATAMEPRVNVIELEPQVDLPELQLALASDPQILSVSRAPVRYLCATRAATSVAAALPPAADSAMWNLKRIGWWQARQRAGFRDADGIKVAVLDTGLDDLHPDLPRPRQYTYRNPDAAAPSSRLDLVGHGTHVAGTIAALVNSVGVHGICNCDLHAWKIFDDVPDETFGDNPEFYASHAMYLRALYECTEAGMDVVNLSIGGPGEPSTAERRAFDRLLARGTIVVAAMGNGGDAGSPTSYPAAIPGVIAVAATGVDDTRTWFSTRGEHCAIAAPGEGIWSTLPTYEADLDGPSGPQPPARREVNYGCWDGTSMATPRVAAAAALLIANRGRMTPGEAKEALQGSADKVPAMRGADHDADYGAGRLNLDALLA